MTAEEKRKWKTVRRIFSFRTRKNSNLAAGEKPTVEWKAQALSDFSAWIEDLPDTPPAGDQATMEACDLFTLLSEFSALRQEIKMQNREQHRTTRNLSEINEAFSRSMVLFEKSIDGIDRLSEQIRRETEKQAVFPFLDVRDALLRGFRAAKTALDRKRWYRPLGKGLIGIVEGYEMAIRRFDRALSQSGISPVPALGQPFDPVTMKAVARRTDPDKGPGIVIEEHVGGFTRGEELLRPSEVTVNSA